MKKESSGPTGNDTDAASPPVVLRQFQQRCADILRELPILIPFDEYQLCAALSARRGRPLILIPLPLRQLIGREDVVYGFVASEHHRDVLYYERDTRRMHQLVIIAHELAHLLLDHQPSDIAQHDLLWQLRHLVPGVAVGHLHRRATLLTHDEREAEIFATMFIKRISRDEVYRRPPIEPFQDATHAILLERLAADLEGV